MRSLLFGTLLFTVACTGVETSHGSQTLHVDAYAEAHRARLDVSGTDAWDTELTVILAKEGQPAHGGQVEITTSAGTILLDEVEAGTYLGTQRGYGEEHGHVAWFELNVRNGDDFVNGVQLAGPQLSTLLSPARDAIQLAGQPLEVRWSPSGDARAELQTTRMGARAVDDNGAFDVPVEDMNAMTVHNARVANPPELLRLIRSRSTAIAGAAEGSRFSVRVENDLQFTVVPSSQQAR